MTFGEKINARRIELHMTMDEVGQRVGIGRSAVNKYEKGHITDPTAAKIIAFANALDLPVMYLLEENADVENMLLTSTERQIILAYRQANDSIQSAVCDILHVQAEKKPIQESSMG